MKHVDVVWARITAHQGKVFRQVRGKEFTYRVVRNVLRPDTTNRNLPKSDFAKALEMVPLAGPGEIQHLQGLSYIFAVLMDRRIRGSDW